MPIEDLIRELLTEEPEYVSLAQQYADELPAILKYYEHATIPIKCRLVSVIAHIPGMEALNALIEAGRGHDEVLRVSAIVAAGAVTERSRIGKLKAFLGDCLTDELESVRNAAVLSLHPNQRKAFKATLEELAESDKSEMVQAAAKQVLAIGEPSAEAALAAPSPQPASSRAGVEIRSDSPEDPVSQIIATDTPLAGMQLGT